MAILWCAHTSSVSNLYCQVMSRYAFSISGKGLKDSDAIKITDLLYNMIRQGIYSDWEAADQLYSFQLHRLKGCNKSSFCQPIWINGYCARTRKKGNEEQRSKDSFYLYMVTSVKIRWHAQNHKLKSPAPCQWHKQSQERQIMSYFGRECLTGKFLLILSC